MPIEPAKKKKKSRVKIAVFICIACFGLFYYIRLLVGFWIGPLFIICIWSLLAVFIVMTEGFSDSSMPRKYLKKKPNNDAF